MNKKIFGYLINRLVAIEIILALITILAITLISIFINERIIIISVFIILYALIFYFAYLWICLPYRETKKVLNIFIRGYTVEEVFKIENHISPEIEATLNKLKDGLNTYDLINATRKQAQYLALQNQINPHFLYNTLEGIRSEAVIAGLDTVADMTEALANFFRYTISNMDQLVYLEDELANVENYYLIQQYRFGEKINLNIEYIGEEKENLFKYRIPKLTLQPIIENAIFHGIERKIEKGHINIKIESTAKRLIITISDDGLGISEDRLNELILRLNTASQEYINQIDEGKGGIAIINVNNRIKLIFGGNYGINIFSKLGVGTDVEITLPLMVKE